MKIGEMRVLREEALYFYYLKLSILFVKKNFNLYRSFKNPFKFHEKIILDITNNAI